ncbi:MAG: putative toxin-antitoxin system toxin component, PIN family [Candidatus ainarchaeum sp.]|nr:putative toxin-antitoxin system toxin component, PIN family [Candidatus ainarchaeum sp.]
MERNGERGEQESYFFRDKRRRCSRYNSQAQKDERLKVVLDTNILISASYWFKNPKKIIDFVLNKEIIVYSSTELIKEYKNSIIRDFDETEEIVGKKAAFFESIFQLIQPTQRVFACEDKDDNKVLEVALEANAEFIISGDKHLLKMNKFNGVKIVTARQFIEFFTP